MLCFCIAYKFLVGLGFTTIRVNNSVGKVPSDFGNSDFLREVFINRFTLAYVVNGCIGYQFWCYNFGSCCGGKITANPSCVTCGMCTDTLGDVHLGGEGRMVAVAHVGHRLVWALLGTLGDVMGRGDVGLVVLCTLSAVCVWASLGTLGAEIGRVGLGGSGLCTLGS